MAELQAAAPVPLSAIPLPKSQKPCWTKKVGIPIYPFCFQVELNRRFDYALNALSLLIVCGIQQFA